MGAGEKSARQDVDIEVMNLFVTFEVIRSMVNSLIIAFTSEHNATSALKIFFFRWVIFMISAFFQMTRLFFLKPI